MLFKKTRYLGFPSGTRDRVSEPRSVAIVGGGLGGVAAATVLAERGAKVTLFEKESYLGGRVGAWTDHLEDGEPFEMERGFHAFFRQYYNLRSLLKRIDPALRNLTPLVDYPVLGPDGYQETFAGLPKTPGLNVAVLTKRTPTLTLKDLTKVNVRAAMAMLGYDVDRTYGRYDSATARHYLDSLNFPAKARRMLFDVFSHSFFNPEEDMSAGEMLMMFHFYFMGNPDGLIFDVLNEPFSDALWKPFERYLTGLGVEIRMDTEIERVEKTDAGWRVSAAGAEPIDAEAAVLAVTVPAMKRIVAASAGLSNEAWRRKIDGLALTRPFAVWRLWLDQECAPGRHEFAGTAGLGVIDNISLYELFEGESRRHVMRKGGSVVEIHAYAVPEDMGEEAVKAELLGKLHALYPETAGATILEERYLWRQDCPAFGPSSFASRPTVETPWDTLMLAGDFVRLPIPSALMERATASGFLAANRLLAKWDTKGEEIVSVPPRGVTWWLGA